MFGGFQFCFCVFATFQHVDFPKIPRREVLDFRSLLQDQSQLHKQIRDLEIVSISVPWFREGHTFGHFGGDWVVSWRNVVVFMLRLRQARRSERCQSKGQLWALHDLTGANHLI